MKTLRINQTADLPNEHGLKERHIMTLDGLMRYSEYLWSIWHGPIPEGMIVDFDDCDHQNHDLENLIVVSSDEKESRYRSQAYKLLTDKARYYSFAIQTAYNKGGYRMDQIKMDEREMMRLLLLADKYRGRQPRILIDHPEDLFAPEPKVVKAEVELLNYDHITLPKPTGNFKNEWSVAELQYLLDNFQLYGNSELAKAVSSLYGVTRSSDAVRYQLDRIGVKRTKEQVKAIAAKPNAGHFNKGHQPHNTLSDGIITTRKDSNGHTYQFIRIGLSNWLHLHVHVWEECNDRPVPEGHNIIFKDGDTMNCHPDNLRCVSDAELLTINKGTDIESKLDQLLASVRYKNAVKVPNYKFTGQLPAEPKSERYYTHDKL